MATAPRRPALDAWLAKADQVLAQAREASLSPSTVPGPWDAHRAEQATTPAGLGRHLEGLLSRLAFGPGRWVLVVEDERGRYVQVLAFEDGSLLAEVVSNNYLEVEDRWSEHDEQRLASLGWELPHLPKRPNWYVASPTIYPDIAELAGLVITALRSVFRLAEGDRLQFADEGEDARQRHSLG